MNENENEKKYKPIIALIIVAVVFAVFGKYSGIAAAVIGSIAFFLDGRADNKKNERESRLIENRLRLSDLRLPANLPFPYAVFDESGNILFYNGEFQKAFEEKHEEKSIYSIFEGLKLGEGISFVEYGERTYNAYIKACEVIDKKKFSDTILSLFLVDVTENKELKDAIERMRLVGAFIFIDNYEEVTEVLQDTSVPILTALIDRKLNAFASDFGGLIKKYEKDRYIFITTSDSLERLKKNKFECLNEIKSVTVGNHLPVTLSIGMCVSSEETSVDNILKDAKSALDLALGRGGDQVVIKENNDYQFFGGLSGEVAHNARIRARVKADAYRELVEGSDSIIVMGHRHPDLDCFGAAIGVMCMARSLNKPCYIVIDEVSSGIRILYDKLMATGEYNGVFINEAEALSLIKNTTLLTVVDTHIRGLVASPAAIEKAKKIVVFDHHRRSADYIEGAVLTYHEPYASSTCELVTEMIQYIGSNIKLNNNEADALLAGITMDTKDFGLKTGAITFEAAAYLRRKGADSTRVRMLMREDIAAHKAKADAIKNAEVYRDSIVISVCSGECKDSAIIAAQAADELLSAVGMMAAFVLCKTDDSIHISGRSFGDINVQVIAEKLGGGGHATIAGLQLENVEIDDAVEKLKGVIDEYLTEVNLL